MKEERQHRYKVLTILTLAFLLTGTLLAYHEPLTTTDTSPVSQSAQSPATELVVTRTVRVAIYLETNKSIPAYATSATFSDYTVDVQNILQDTGCQVTNLTRADISQHKLLTASYDVFVMVDNLPRENITNLVKEFWLSGGGVLSLDSAISYICYAGMLPPESEGSDGFGVYWSYSPIKSEHNVTARHPATKALDVNDTVTTPALAWGAFDWTVLQTTSVASDVFKLGTKKSFPNLASMVALDPSLKGGRVVQLPCNGSFISLSMEKIIVDAVDWLCPHPKARVLFDLTHRPYYGIDFWDFTSGLVNETGNHFSSWRNALVNRSYTVDKLYPSASGNLTAARLAPYDLLIVFTPRFNFTAAEVATVTAWINAGGGLLAIGEVPSVVSIHNRNINYLLSSLSLKMENIHNSLTGTFSYFVKHPTTEGCSQIYINWGGYVNCTGSAYPIWGVDASNTVVGGQSYGSGRVILASDYSMFENTMINNADCYVYVVNIVNWLTAAKADVLIYVHQTGSGDHPYRLAYRGAVASALNDLAIKFYLSSSPDYFNFSLHLQTWSLVIIDQPSSSIISYFPEILNYMKAGGHLILSTWQYPEGAGIPLFDYMGFKYIGGFTSIKKIFVWNAAHDIFTQPNHYSASNITTTHDHFSLNCANLTTYANASAVAGLGKASSTLNASIILGAGGRAIANAMLLTEYYDDTDDSTYPDSFEIWENEIAYMMRPQCTLTPIVSATANQGMLSISANVTSLGLSAAMEGSVTLSVPAGFGTLLTSAAQSIASPLDPGTNGTVAWQVNATGVGAYTLGFALGYKGFKNTSYGAASTAGIVVRGVFVVTAAFDPGTTVVQGTQLVANLTVKDYGGAAVTDAAIDADLSGTTVTYTHLGSGVYKASINTTTLTPNTYSLNVNTSKTGYNSYVHSYTITVQAPGGGTTTTTTGGGGGAIDYTLVIIVVIVVVAIVLVAAIALMIRKRRG